MGLKSLLRVRIHSGAKSTQEWAWNRLCFPMGHVLENSELANKKMQMTTC